MNRAVTMFWISLAIVVSTSGCTSTAFPSLPGTIVIGDDELSVDQVFSTQPMIGFRTFSSTIPEVIAPRIKATGIPADLFIESAKATPWVKGAITRAGKDPATATLDDWYLASRSTAALAMTARTQPHSTITVRPIPDHALTADPYFVSSLPETEIFKSVKPKTYVTTFEDKSIELIEVDPEAFAIFKDSYARLGLVKK